MFQAIFYCLAFASFMVSFFIIYEGGSGVESGWTQMGWILLIAGRLEELRG